MSEHIERYWRDATPEDAIKEPPMMARFKYKESGEWFIGKLCGCWRDLHGDNPKWGDGSGLCHTTCQVYDAPDPGEGWRWVDEPEVGDEYMLLDGPEIGFKQVKTKWLAWSPDHVFRRRIEPPKPKYEPFRWEDREQLRGRLITFVDHNRTVEFRCESFEVDDNMFTVNNAYADWLCKHAVFVDTKEPVGRRVE